MKINNLTCIMVNFLSQSICIEPINIVMKFQANMQKCSNSFAEAFSTFSSSLLLHFSRGKHINVDYISPSLWLLFTEKNLHTRVNFMDDKK